MLRESSLIHWTYLFGFLLPGLEIVRRGTNLGYWPNYFDDFLIGGLLLCAAYCAQSGRRYGRHFLIASWAVLCGGFYYSFTGQFQVADDVSHIPNTLVVLIKAILYAAAVYFCVCAVIIAANGSKKTDT